MMLLNLDNDSSKPKYQQIIDQIREKIASNSLLPGEKLPSTRQLALTLDVHRSTVSTAYQELWALGYIDFRPGACPRVRKRARMVSASSECRESLIDWSQFASPAGNKILDVYREFSSKVTTKNPDVIDFSSLNIDSRLFPVENLATCLNKVVKDQGNHLLSYGNHKGYLPLRNVIAHRLQHHGISVSAEQILITNGSQQAIDLVLRMIAAPGKSVAFEVPTYDCMLPLLHFHRLKPVEIPMNHEGMDLKQLEKVLRKEPPAVIYTMPTFHNPTGISTSQSHREQLLSLCETYRIPLLEDGFEEEMKYFGRVILPIKSMDKHQLVIYCGTFSKVLFPGIRIGWVAAGNECIERLTAIRRFSEVSSNTLMQAAIHEFCAQHFYDRHIAKMHRIYRKRMQTAIHALRKYIAPHWAEWSEPGGGYLIWLKLKTHRYHPNEMKDIFASFGVLPAPGNFFFLSQPPESYLRLSISSLNEDEITEGISRLSNALSRMFN